MHFENSNELIFYYILQYLRKNRPLLLGLLWFRLHLCLRQWQEKFVGFNFELNLVIVTHQNIATALLFSFFVHTKGLQCALALLPWLPTTE